jgi:hypothetical protein
MPFGQVAYGPTNLGRVVGCLADAEQVRWKVGGAAIDTTAYTPLAADYTIPGSGEVIRAGNAYFRYGQVFSRINTGTAWSAGGKIGLFVPWSPAMTATTVASGGTVLGVYTLTLAAVTNINPGDILTVDTAGQQELLQVLSVSGSVVTFVTATTKTHANGVAVTKVDDGRQTLRRGESYILNHTRTMKDDIFSDQGIGFFDGGTAYINRIASDYSGGVATNPTRAQIEAAFPDLSWVVD